MMSERGLSCRCIVHFDVAATMEDAENHSSNGSPSSLDLSYSSLCFEGSNDSDGTLEVDDAHQGSMYEPEQSDGSPSSEEHSSSEENESRLGNTDW